MSKPSHCEKCGGIREIRVGAIVHRRGCMMLNDELTERLPLLNSGWVCPICGRSNSPAVPYCMGPHQEE